ncbi:MAG TPA: methyl-accepting chemotaxis protein, partial [bacterium]|nr:methyl-accepting chemotaxis protein [bacterium]
QNIIVKTQGDIYRSTLKEISKESNEWLSQTAKSNITSLLEFITTNALEAFNTFDFSALNRYMEVACANNKEILYAYVTDMTGNALTSFLNEKNEFVNQIFLQGMSMKELAPKLTEKYSLIKFEKLLVDATTGEKKGFIYIGFYDYYIKKSIENQTQKLIDSQNQIDQMVKEKVNSAISTIGILSVTAIIIMALIIYCLMRGLLAKPLNKITMLLNDIADGKLQLEKVQVKSNDETGKISSAFNKMLDGLNKILIQAKLIADDNLEDEKLNEKIKGDLGESFSVMIEKLKNLALQARLIANDDLYNSNLRIDISGSLGGAFSEMVTKLRALAEQAKIIAKDELENKKLIVDASGSLGEAFSDMIKNLRTLAEQAKIISTGNISDRRLSIEHKGTLGSAFADVVTMLQNISKQAAALAKGDLNNSILDLKLPGEVGDNFSTMTINLRKLIANLEQVIKQVEDASKNLQTVTNSISVISTEYGKMSSEESFLVNDVNTALTQFSSSIQHIGNNCDKGKSNAQIVNSTVEDGCKVISELFQSMEEINDAMKKTAAQLQELNESSRKISNIVNIITSISEKTSLLALNAAIEAARAGESGRGFAVVADEVNKLSEQTQKSVKEISMLVDTIKTQSEISSNSMKNGINLLQKGVELTEKSTHAFKQISSSITETNDSIIDISDSVKEQSSVVSSIVSITDRLKDISDKVLLKSKDLTESGEVLSASTQNLIRLLNK